MIQKNNFSPTSSLFRGPNERSVAYKSLMAPGSENKENLWKRKVDDEGERSTVSNPCAWKRQRCGYNDGGTLNGTEGVKTIAGTMNAVHKKRKLPSDGVSFMKPLDISNSASCDAMAVDDALDYINPEDYYEDKWH